MLIRRGKQCLHCSLQNINIALICAICPWCVAFCPVTPRFVPLCQIKCTILTKNMCHFYQWQVQFCHVIRAFCHIICANFLPMCHFCPDLFCIQYHYYITWNKWKDEFKYTKNKVLWSYSIISVSIQSHYKIQ
jgi:hypothetical protein